jgi:hypothetical protein
VQKGLDRERRVSKEELIEKGIYKPEAIFGNDLVNLFVFLLDKMANSKL